MPCHTEISKEITSKEGEKEIEDKKLILTAIDSTPHICETVI